MKQALRAFGVVAGLVAGLVSAQTLAASAAGPDTDSPSGHVILGPADREPGRGPGALGTSVTAYTTDVNPGGKGVFEDYGEHLKACDVGSDGYRAVAYLYWIEGGYEHLAWRHDADGANGNCLDNNLEIGEGVYVQLQVCLRDGANGADVFCSAWRGGYA